MYRYVAVLCALAVYVAAAVPATASVPALDVRTDRHAQSLSPYLEIFEDPSAALTLADVMARSGEFRPEAGPRPNFGMSGSAFWFHATLSGIDRSGPRWLIEVAAPVLDDVTVYFTDSDGLIGRQLSGDMRAFASRPYAHRNPVFPVPQGESTDIGVWCCGARTLTCGRTAAC
jgi:hypothetical protein